LGFKMRVMCENLLKSVWRREAPTHFKGRIFFISKLK